MVNDTLEELQTTSNSSTEMKKGPIIHVLKERKSILINPKSIKSCDILQILVIGYKIENIYSTI